MHAGVGPGFFLYLNSVEIYDSLIRVSDDYKDTLVYYKQTLINIGYIAITATDAIDYVGGGAREVISDLN